MGHALFETQRPIQLSHDLTQNPLIPFSILHQRNRRKANEVYESRIRFAGWNLGRRCYVPGFYVDTSASRAFIILSVSDLFSANCTYHDYSDLRTRSTPDYNSRLEGQLHGLLSIIDVAT